MAECLFCGSDHLKTVTLKNHALTICQLCGEPNGSAEAIEAYMDHMDADRRGMDATSYALTKLIEEIPGFTVTSASGGDADLLIPPFVAFRIHEAADLQNLEKLLGSLRPLEGKSRTRWIVQAVVVKDLLFELKPNFAVSGAGLTREAILQAIADLAMLLQTLERDMRLNWWRGATQ